MTWSCSFLLFLVGDLSPVLECELLFSAPSPGLEQYWACTSYPISGWLMKDFSLWDYVRLRLNLTPPHPATMAGPEGPGLKSCPFSLDIQLCFTWLWASVCCLWNGGDGPYPVGWLSAPYCPHEIIMVLCLSPVASYTGGFSLPHLLFCQKHYLPPSWAQYRARFSGDTQGFRPWVFPDFCWWSSNRLSSHLDV